MVTTDKLNVYTILETLIRHFEKKKNKLVLRLDELKKNNSDTDYIEGMIVADIETINYLKECKNLDFLFKKRMR